LKGDRKEESSNLNREGFCCHQKIEKGEKRRVGTREGGVGKKTRF